MDRSPSRSSPVRDLVLFICGPALVMIAVAAWFAVAPWPVPVPQQAQEFTLAPLATSLVVGAFGVWLSSRVGLPSAPALTDIRRWTWLVLASAGLGVALVAATAIMDASLGLERFMAQRIGRPSINVPFPASVAHYLYGGIAQESLFRIGPVPILAWLIGKLAFRDATKAQVFWAVAMAFSLLQPALESVMVFRARPDIALTMLGVGLVGSIAWVGLYRRFGWPAVLVVRIVVELGWHVVWPALSV